MALAVADAAPAHRPRPAVVGGPQREQGEVDRPGRRRRDQEVQGEAARRRARPEELPDGHLHRAGRRAVEGRGRDGPQRHLLPEPVAGQVLHRRDRQEERLVPGRQLLRHRALFARPDQRRRRLQDR